MQQAQSIRLLSLPNIAAVRTIPLLKMQVRMPSASLSVIGSFTSASQFLGMARGPTAEDRRQLLAAVALRPKAALTHRLFRRIRAAG